MGSDEITGSTIWKYTADQTAKAQWSAITTIKVTFDSNISTDYQEKNLTVPSAKTVTYDGTYGALTDATRTGYTFGGWYSEAACTNKVTSGTKVTNHVNHTLYAKWTANDISVSVTGTNVTPATASTTVKAHASYSVTFTANTGYSLPTDVNVTIGGTKVAKDVAYTYAAGILTIKAGYINEAVEVTIDAIAGDNTVTFVISKRPNDEATLTYTGSSSIKSGTAYTATLTRVTGYDLPETITVEINGETLASGYTYNKSTGAISINANEVVGNIVITANGVVRKPTVTYWTNDSTDAKTTATVEYDKAYGTLPTVTYTGYTFGGWYTEQLAVDADTTGKTEVEATTVVSNEDNHNLYAYWTKKSVQVNVSNYSGTENEGTVTGTGSYKTGDVVTFTATANNGFNFVKVVKGTDASVAGLTNNQYTITAQDTEDGDALEFRAIYQVT